MEIRIPGSAYTCIAKEHCSFSLHVECASFLEMINFEFPDINHKTNSTLFFLRKYQPNCKCVICGCDCLVLFKNDDGDNLIHDEEEQNLIHDDDEEDNLIYYDKREDNWIDEDRIFFGFCCAFCFKYIEVSYEKKVFYYKCEKCAFRIHSLCAMLPRDLNHQSHEHSLCIYKKEKVAGSSRKPRCQACGFPCEKLVSLECEICDFYLHIQCFLLPYTGKHINHRHNLNLTYSYKEDPRALEYFCDICEKPRTPNRWVYCCPDPKCYIVAHTNCVIPNPFIPSQLN